MCAVPVDGLHKDDVTHEQLVKIQGLLKRRIPTGTTSCLAHQLLSHCCLLDQCTLWSTWHRTPFPGGGDTKASPSFNNWLS